MSTLLPRTLVADKIHPDAEAWLAGHCEIVRLHDCALSSVAPSCEALIVRTTTVDAALLASCDRLRVIAKHGTGTDNIDVAAASSRGVVVTSCAGDNAPAVAEFTLACVLLMLRPIVAGAAWLRAQDGRGSMLVRGQQAGLLGGELSSRTVGVVGWGSVGRRVGLATRALGAAVLVHDPERSRDEIAVDDVHVAPDLGRLLASADIVTLHLPLTPATAGMMGARELEAMRPGSFLINTSRGGIVDEAALAASVAGGHLAGAAVDVFAQEPPPRDHPLLALDRVLCTPHMAGSTREAMMRMGMTTVRSVVDVLAGRIPEHAVNPGVSSSRLI